MAAPRRPRNLCPPIGRERLFQAVLKALIHSNVPECCAGSRADVLFNTRAGDINRIPSLHLTLIMSASDHLDMLPADARATTPDVSDNGFSVEDAEADYQSRDSYISDKDEDGTAENNKDGELELLQWNSSDRRWEAIRARYVIGIRDMV